MEIVWLRDCCGQDVSLCLTAVPDGWGISPRRGYEGVFSVYAVEQKHKRLIAQASRRLFLLPQNRDYHSRGKRRPLKRLHQFLWKFGGKGELGPWSGLYATGLRTCLPSAGWPAKGEFPWGSDMSLA